MKTAISIPDPLFSWFEKHAKTTKLSRSELYARALAAYKDRISLDGLTEQANVFADESDKALEKSVDQAARRAWKDL